MWRSIRAPDIKRAAGWCKAVVDRDEVATELRVERALAQVDSDGRHTVTGGREC